MNGFALELFCVYLAIAVWFATEKGWFAPTALPAVEDIECLCVEEVTTHESLEALVPQDVAPQVVVVAAVEVEAEVEDQAAEVTGVKAAVEVETAEVKTALALYMESEDEWAGVYQALAIPEDEPQSAPTLLENGVDQIVAAYGCAASDSDSDYVQSELGESSIDPSLLPVENKVAAKPKRRSLAATGRGFQKK